MTVSIYSFYLVLYHQTAISAAVESCSIILNSKLHHRPIMSTIDLDIERNEYTGIFSYFYCISYSSLS